MLNMQVRKFILYRWITFIKSLLFCIAILIAILASCLDKCRLHLTTVFLIVVTVRATTLLQTHSSLARLYPRSASCVTIDATSKNAFPYASTLTAEGRWFTLTRLHSSRDVSPGSLTKCHARYENNRIVRKLYFTWKLNLVYIF